MPEKAFEISVQQPCSQDWQSMQPIERGRHCLSCQKSVVDFTTMTDQEVYLHLAQASGKVCGRFRPTQLKQYRAQHVPRPASSWQRYLLSLSAVLGLGRLETIPVQAQGITEQRVAKQQITPLPPHSGSLVTQPILLKGKVTLADDGTRQPGVTIVVKGTTWGTVTNNQGEYELSLPEWNSPVIELVYSYIGYQTVERVIPTDEAATAVAVALEADVHMLGEVSFIHVKYRFPKNVLMFPAKVFHKAKCLVGL